MDTPPIVSPEEWEAARQQLLVQEKELTRSRDALAAARRRMPWVAVERDVHVRRTDRHGEPRRPVRRASAAHRVPRLLRAGRVRLARARLPWLLDGGRPRRPPRPPERPRHHAGLRLTSRTLRHRTGEGADGLGDALVHHHRRLRHRLRCGSSGTAPTPSSATAIASYRTYLINNRGDESLGSTWSYLDMTALGRQETWRTPPPATPRRRRTSGGTGTTSTATARPPTRSGCDASPAASKPPEGPIDGRPRARRVTAHVGGMPLEEVLLPLITAAGAGTVVACSWVRSHLRRSRPTGHDRPRPAPERPS